MTLDQETWWRSSALAAVADAPLAVRAAALVTASAAVARASKRRFVIALMLTDTPPHLGG
jgi:hypothetical protein